MTDMPEINIPTEFENLTDAELTELSEQARAAFDTVYGDGAALTDDNVAYLATITEGIERLAAEQTARAEAVSAREAQAAELAARVAEHAAAPDAEDEEEPATEVDEDAPEEDEDATKEEEPAEEAEANEPITEEGADKSEATEDTDTTDSAATTEEEENVAITASGNGTPMKNIQRQAHKAPTATLQKNVSDVLVASGEGLDVAPGTGIDWLEAGEALNKRVGSYNSTAFANAAASGRHMRQQSPLLQVRREFASDVTVTSNDAEHVEAALAAAVDQSRTAQGSLVASGGWCAPSEIMYDLLELESRDGLLSIPEINVVRGGVSFAKGMSFADIFKTFAGFHFTEANDIAGEYVPGANPTDPNTTGEKPCVKIDCPEFEEHRLDVAGLCITGGILARRGYPEYHARIIRGALTAHAHRVNGLMIAEMEKESTAVALPATQAGTAAPVLTAIELQVEHYRYTHRLNRNTTLEAVFPYWVQGAIRSDLSRRLGVELLAVTNEMIRNWFNMRGISPQFVYNWQTIEQNEAGKFTAWPTEVKFLLYVAGTWLRGSTDVITVDSLFDSNLVGWDANLRTNDYTALFTEEGYFVAMRGDDSRVITVPIEADGATHQGIEIAANGTLAAAAA